MLHVTALSLTLQASPSLSIIDMHDSICCWHRCSKAGIKNADMHSIIMCLFAMGVLNQSNDDCMWLREVQKPYYSFKGNKRCCQQPWAHALGSSATLISLASWMLRAAQNINTTNNTLWQGRTVRERHVCHNTPRLLPIKTSTWFMRHVPHPETIAKTSVQQLMCASASTDTITLQLDIHWCEVVTCTTHLDIVWHLSSWPWLPEIMVYGSSGHWCMCYMHNSGRFIPASSPCND